MYRNFYDDLMFAYVIHCYVTRNCLILSIYYNLLYLIVIDIVIIHYYHQIFTLNKGLSYFLETFRSITIYFPGNNLLFMVVFQKGSRKYLVLLFMGFWHTLANKINEQLVKNDNTPKAFKVQIFVSPPPRIS